MQCNGFIVMVVLVMMIGSCIKKEILHFHSAQPDFYTLSVTRLPNH